MTGKIDTKQVSDFMSKNVGRKLRDCETGVLLTIIGVCPECHNYDVTIDNDPTKEIGSVRPEECHEVSEAHKGCLYPFEHADLIEPCINDCFTWVEVA